MSQYRTHSLKHWIKRSVQWLLYKRKLGAYGRDCDIHFPCFLGKKSHIFLGDYALVQPYCRFIIHTGRVIIGRWTSVSCNCLIVTGNHVPTVGVNQRILERYHINDREQDVVIGEDCWVGAGATLLGGTHLGRGSVVGAGALVNKVFPPYAVVVGCPARIIASKFTLEQILIHESQLYPEAERLSRSTLENIFREYYQNKKAIGTDCLSRADWSMLEQHHSMQYATDKIVTDANR